MQPLRALALLLPVLGTAAPLAAGDPVLLLHFTGAVSVHGGVEVGWLTQKQRSDYDNCTVRICEGDEPQADIANVQNAKGGLLSSLLSHPGTWTLRFGGFLTTCSPKMYLRIPDGTANPPTLFFTAYGYWPNDKISVVDPFYSSTGKRFFTIGSDRSSVTVDYPAP